MSQNYLYLPFDPIADPAAVVTAGNVRVTVLTARLLRLEYSPTGAFEERPSQAFWFRRQPMLASAFCSEDSRTIITSGLAVTWRMHQ
jgi:hypothetical protein